MIHEQIDKGIPFLTGLKKGFAWKQIESKLDGWVLKHVDEAKAFFMGNTVDKDEVGEVCYVFREQKAYQFSLC